MRLAWLSAYLVWVHTLVGVAASTGDRLPEFQDCNQQCVSRSCPRDLGLVLRAMLWTCRADCDYMCQQALTDSHESHGMRTHQYHGKWPFKRFLGIQEPASVLFSVMNLWPNYAGYRKLKLRTHNSDGFYMKNYYLAFGIVGVNAWLWSSVFHARDFVLTERLDYFSAIGQILFGMFLALVRLFRLDRPSAATQRNIVAAVLSTFYICHVYYLGFVRFNYAYNMLAGVIVGFSQTTLWIFLALKLYVRSHDRMDLLPIAIVLSVLLGSSFELNDFSPYWRAIDAHSLWHLSTVLPTYFWYRWMLHDMQPSYKKMPAYKLSIN